MFIKKGGDSGSTSNSAEMHSNDNRFYVWLVKLFFNYFNIQKNNNKIWDISLYSTGYI